MISFKNNATENENHIFYSGPAYMIYKTSPNQKMRRRRRMRTERKVQARN
jgi:hypothetical protein